MSSVANLRRTAFLERAKILASLPSLVPVVGSPEKTEKDIESFFPHLKNKPLVQFKKGPLGENAPLRVGVVFSGGPAAGGHNVIVGLWEGLQQLNSSNVLIGFLGGPEGILKNKSLEITEALVASVRNQGGFYLLGTGRTKIESDEQMQTCLEVVRENRLDGLVIVGGDDSNTNAAVLAEYFLKKGERAAVVGIPKTIDGDLKNTWVEISFGFDTASKVYSELVGNLISDAVSQGKYTFFVKMMGRAASHLLLETALQARPHLALISEEIAALKWPLEKVITHICDLLEERSLLGKNYAVILIPEGVIEFIPDFALLLKELGKKAPAELEGSLKLLYESLPASIQQQLLAEKDPHGNIPVSKIETERLVIALVEDALQKRGRYRGTFSPQGYFCGYEGRSGFPTPFDASYCYNLGLTASLLVQHRLTGCMATLKKLSAPASEWEPCAVPLTLMMQMEERKGVLKPVIIKSLVDREGPLFKYFASEREACRLKDHLDLPGPIQFEILPDSAFRLPYLLSLS